MIYPSNCDEPDNLMFKIGCIFAVFKTRLNLFLLELIFLLSLNTK